MVIGDNALVLKLHCELQGQLLRKFSCQVEDKHVQGLPIRYHPFIRNALGGGGSPNVLSAFPPYTLGLGLSYVQIFVCLVFGLIVCLVSSFRYNGLARPRGPFGPACGPFGPAAGPWGPQMR